MNSEEKVRMITRLAELREYIAKTKEVSAMLEQEYKQTVEYGRYEDSQAQMKDACAEEKTLVDQIKSAALEDYNTTHEKPSVNGLSLRVNHVLQYVQSEVEQWAKTKMPELFKFDKAAFEKHAKAVADTIPVPGVTIIDDPTITIASDLSEYISLEKPLDSEK